MSLLTLLWIAICFLGLIEVGASFHAAMVDWQLVRIMGVNGLNQLVTTYILRMEALRLLKLLLFCGLGIVALIDPRSAGLALTPVLFAVVVIIVTQTVFDRRLRRDTRRFV